jgi:hypothetical protein
MTYTLRFLPSVEEDALAGFVWYEVKASGLGEEFLRMFYASASELTYNPLLYPKVYGEFQRCLLRRFPYAIYFRTIDNQIVVFGLFHCARDPHTIKIKLQERDEPKRF